MIEITLTIVTFSLMLIIFKYFEIFKVNNLQAIIVNYITAGVLALVADGSVLTNNFSITNLFQPTFIYYALIIGILFIITFNTLHYIVTNTIIIQRINLDFCNPIFQIYAYHSTSKSVNVNI